MLIPGGYRKSITVYRGVTHAAAVFTASYAASKPAQLRRHHTGDAKKSLVGITASLIIPEVLVN